MLVKYIRLGGNNNHVSHLKEVFSHRTFFVYESLGDIDVLEWKYISQNNMVKIPCPCFKKIL